MTDLATSVGEGNGSKLHSGDCPAATERVSASTVMVEIVSLMFEDSPRGGGEGTSYTQALAETDDPLPPIVVHWKAMRVIDGMHRVQPAKLRGRKEDYRFYFDGDTEVSLV